MKKLKGFHQCESDYDYLLWTWKDYALRWCIVLAVSLLLMFLICTQGD